jgi:hypothetical protein
MTSKTEAAGVGMAVVATFLRVVSASIGSSAIFLRDNCWGVYSASSRTLHAINRPEVRLILRRRWSMQSAVLLQLLTWSARTVARNVRGSVRTASARCGAAMHAKLMDAALHLMGANAPLPAIEYDDHGFFDEFNDVLETPKPSRLHPRVKSATKTPSATAGYDSSAEDEFEVLPSPEDDPAFYSESKHKHKPVKLLLSERASVAPSEALTSPMCLENYLCGCGDCPQYEAIAQDVDEYATWLDETEKMRATRLLQALSTYSEDIEYSREMVVAAEECLQVWQGDEDRAFKSMTVLFDELPRLCAGSA